MNDVSGETDTAGAFNQRLSSVLKPVIPGFVELSSIERLSGGASQETYRLEASLSSGPMRLAFRRAPTAAPLGGSAPGIETEALLMQAARAAGVPTPQIFHVLAPEDRLGRGFIMEWLDGEALGARIARSPDFAELRAKLAHECGRILARIHDIDFEQTGLKSRLHTQTAEMAVKAMQETYNALGTPQPMLDYAGRWLMENLPPSGTLRLVHNDFRNGNIMVGPDRVVAVLDWELAHIGDPVRDLGWLCTNSWRFGVTQLPVGGFGTREDLLAGYEAECGRRISPQHLRFWEVFGSYWWGISSLAMAKTYRSGDDPSVERPAIGRRTAECQIDLVNYLLPAMASEVLQNEPIDDGALPTRDELLESVSQFLRGALSGKLKGRDAFLAQVAANSVDIVRREIRIMAHEGHGLHDELQALLGRTGSSFELKRQVCTAIREGSFSMEDPRLGDWLRRSTMVQVAIDQPKYSGYRTAIGEAVGETNRIGHG